MQVRPGARLLKTERKLLTHDIGERLQHRIHVIGPRPRPVMVRFMRGGTPNARPSGRDVLARSTCHVLRPRTMQSGLPWSAWYESQMTGMVAWCLTV